MKLCLKKYESTKYYWENGRLGSSYQTYLDADFVIEMCLPRYEQVIEKDLLLEARRKQYLSTLVQEVTTSFYTLIKSEPL